MKTAAAVLVLLALTGCATSQKILRPGGVSEYRVECPPSLSWGVCYSKANEVCPDGYNTLAQTYSFFSGKELRIQCASTVASRPQ